MEKGALHTKRPSRVRPSGLHHNGNAAFPPLPLPASRPLPRRFPASGGPSPLPPELRIALRLGDVVHDKGDGEHDQCPEQARHEGVQIAELVDALPRP